MSHEIESFGDLSVDFSKEAVKKHMDQLCQKEWVWGGEMSESVDWAVNLAIVRYLKQKSKRVTHFDFNYVIYIPGKFSGMVQTIFSKRLLERPELERCAITMRAFPESEVMTVTIHPIPQDGNITVTSEEIHYKEGVVGPVGYPGPLGPGPRQMGPTGIPSPYPPSGEYSAWFYLMCQYLGQYVFDRYRPTDFRHGSSLSECALVGKLGTLIEWPRGTEKRMGFLHQNLLTVRFSLDGCMFDLGGSQFGVPIRRAPDILAVIDLLSFFKMWFDNEGSTPMIECFRKVLFSYGNVEYTLDNIPREEFDFFLRCYTTQYEKARVRDYSPWERMRFKWATLIKHQSTEAQFC